MLTVTMVRKSDNSGYRLYITPEMEGYPADENQAAAYMNKIIEKEIMRARSNISGSIAVSRLARWGSVTLHLKKAARPFILAFRIVIIFIS